MLRLAPGRGLFNRRRFHKCSCVTQMTAQRLCRRTENTRPRPHGEPAAWRPDGNASDTRQRWRGLFRENGRWGAGVEGGEEEPRPYGAEKWDGARDPWRQGTLCLTSPRGPRRSRRGHTCRASRLGARARFGGLSTSRLRRCRKRRYAQGLLADPGPREPGYGHRIVRRGLALPGSAPSCPRLLQLPLVCWLL